MKTLQILLLSLAFILTGFVTSIAQKHSAKHDDEATVTIKINGKERDLETYMEEWGEEFGRDVELLFDGKTNISLNFDEDELDMALDNISIAIENLTESFVKTIEEAVTHMTIEVNDIDPEKIEDSDIHFDDGELDDLIDEIEDKYNSKVKNIDNMKIKIREDYVKIEMDVTLDNGRQIDKVKIIHHD